jgi:hypothetical protein
MLQTDDNDKMKRPWVDRTAEFKGLTALGCESGAREGY